MRIILSLMILILTTGCTMRPSSFDGEIVTYKHGKAIFRVVKSDAEKQCASVGKLAKHDRTDCYQESCSSSFLCIGKHQE